MSDAKDRRIAELEAKVAELEKRPVLEADVLASFSAFDANGDGFLTKDEVVAMLLSAELGRTGESPTLPPCSSASGSGGGAPASAAAAARGAAACLLYTSPSPRD